MADGEEVFGEEALQLGVEREEAEGVGDGGAALADALGGGVLREVEVAHEAGVAAARVAGRPAGALPVVLQERPLHPVAVVDTGQRVREGVEHLGLEAAAEIADQLGEAAPAIVFVQSVLGTDRVLYAMDYPYQFEPDEVIATDAIARFKRLDGYDVFFLTGTDEHGVRIFTGAPMPPGADTVFMQEDVQVEGDTVILPPGLKPGSNSRLTGEDVKKGAVVLPAGRRLATQDIALAAGIGLTRLKVRRRVRVALFSTGDEIVEPGQPRPNAATYDANRYLLSGMLERLGATVTDLGIIRDESAVLAKGIGDAAKTHDLVLTSGGVSTGGASWRCLVSSEGTEETMTNGRRGQDPEAGFGTRAIHAGEAPDPVTRAHNTPIYLTATFTFETGEEKEAAVDGALAWQPDTYFYSRTGNPTTTALERKLASLEGAEDAVVGASGMAAVASLVYSIVHAGDHLLVARYGGDANRSGSVSSAVSQTITRASTTTTLTSSLAPSSYGATVVFTATVSPAMMPGNQRSACAVPFSASTAATAVERKGEGDRLRPISSSTTPASTWPRPRPP